VGDPSTDLGGSGDVTEVPPASPEQALLDALHLLLAGARHQQAILRESLATAVAFLDRRPD